MSLQIETQNISNNNNKKNNNNKNKKIKKDNKNIDNITLKNSDIDNGINLKFFLHEILNPLNIINNCAELIEPEKESCQKLTSIILEQVEECSQLSENILFALNNNQYNNINLCDFLKEIKQKFEMNYQSDINLILNVNCNKIKLKFNQVYLKVIIDNLLKNAFQHSQKITIVLERFFNDTFTIFNEPAFKIIVKNDKSKYNNKNKKSNMVGLELINTMCQRMNIDWNFFEEDNEFRFILFLTNLS